MQSVMNLKARLLLLAIVLVASLATMAVVSNPAFAGTGFKNKGECMEYVIHSLKVNRDVAAKFCAEY